MTNPGWFVHIQFVHNVQFQSENFVHNVQFQSEKFWPKQRPIAAGASSESAKLCAIQIFGGRSQYRLVSKFVWGYVGGGSMVEGEVRSKVKTATC